MMTQQSLQEEEDELQVVEANPEGLPRLTVAVKDAKATRELMFTLRHFHLGDPAAGGRLAKVGDDLLPALLNPYRDSSKLRYNYPLFLAPHSSEKQLPDEESVQAIDRWLQNATAEFAPAKESARILKDHLPWLGHRMRGKLADKEGPVNAAAMLAETANALQEHLKLNGEAGQNFKNDVEKLLQQIPENAELLGYGRYPALHLLIHAALNQALPRRTRFKEQIERCIYGLKRLFEVEWGKSDESMEPRVARDSIGLGSNFFNPEALSEVMEHSHGTYQMPNERRERIQRVLATLESWQPDPVLVRFIHIGSLADTDNWVSKSASCEALADHDPCAKAMEIFDLKAAEFADIFCAVRIAELEIKGIYNTEIHDPWFANFHWNSFSQEELLLVPTVIALGAADQVAGEGLRSLSRLLSSGRPVQILIRVQPHNNPGAAPDEGPFHAFRTELGYLGIAHRQAVVTQSSPARHQHLLHCFNAAFETARTSLHVINTGLRPPSKLVTLNAWLVAGAAIESRAHPFFRINPAAGDSAAARMDFSENPQPEIDWPVHTFRYLDENELTVESELGFTFADYALLLARLRDYFRYVPAECDSHSLTPVDRYLAMSPEQTRNLVPFVWAVDGNHILHRLVVSIDVTNAARDRRNYWRALQEMAGIRNRYVERAVAETRTEERRLAAETKNQLLAEHTAELNRVRTEAAGEAMQRLTDMLLGLDAGTLPYPAPVASVKKPAAVEQAGAETGKAPAAEQKQAEPAEAEESLSFDEPWIDTPLCTSCNDCLKVNALLFTYNEEKQALLGDPKKGTYAQLVQAAELCPAKCIHPGMPLNPDEPGLDALIQRAAPFNQ
ncbi:MAG: ferredoxin [Gammaproteobacteria bacterium]|nr:ferredoxin [Gammaproteobacteria bacterium]